MSLDLNLKNAVQYLHDHAQGMRAVLVVADAVDEVAKLEQLAQEATNRKAVVEAEIRRLDKQADALAEQIKERHASDAKAKAKARDGVDQAHIDAANILLNAKAEAREIVRVATSTITDEIAALAERRDTVNRELVEASDRFEDAVVNLEEARVSTKELEARAAKAKAYLDKLTKE